VKRQHLGLYAIALAILIAGLALAGVPLQTMLFGLFVLACPLMMMFMMGGHGGHGGSDKQEDDHHAAGPRDG
jgi:cytochrome b561